MEYKLIKTDSGTDWEAYQVVRTDTARWVEDDVYSQITTSTGDGEVRPKGSRNRMDLPSDIINPNSEYGKGFYDGYNQTLAEVEKMIDKCFSSYDNKWKIKTNEREDFIIMRFSHYIKQELQKLKGEGK